MLMILLVVSVSTAFYAYTSNGLGSYSSNLSNVFSNQGESISQHMSIEQATFNVSNSLLPYTPVTISNSQTIATLTPFQQLVTINPSSYTSYEASDLGNIRFFSTLSDNAFFGPLDSWLESSSGPPANSANSASFWLNLPKGIPASSSVTVYMVFEPTSTEFDGNVAGEAPQLSAPYGEYDNGGNVFSAYVNGNTPTSQFNLGSEINLTQAVGVPYPGTSGINALYLTGTGTYITIVYSGAILANSPMMAESNFDSKQTPTSQGTVSFDDSIAPSSSQNAIGIDMGYGSSFFSEAYESSGTYNFDLNQKGTANTNWNYGSLTYLGSSATSYSGYIAPQLYSTNGGYGGTENANPLSGSSKLYLSILSSADSSYPDGMYYNWIRVRAYPPNGVAPGDSFGSFISALAQSPGANIYIRNTGTVPVALASVYVQNVTSDTFVMAYSVSPQINVQPGSFAMISIPFTPDPQDTYQFTVVTSLGTPQIQSFPG